MHDLGWKEANLDKQSLGSSGKTRILFSKGSREITLLVRNLSPLDKFKTFFHLGVVQRISYMEQNEILQYQHDSTSS